MTTFLSTGVRQAKVEFGPAYRHKLANGRIAGANLTFDSVSNQPFHSVDQLTVRGTAFLRVPQGERSEYLSGLSHRNENRIDVHDGPFVIRKVTVRL